jgi:hypothetical protein|tara:strand:- start:2042 stop:2377 length:336 start_codon:yes stop_codon:yes gene_type:complete
MLKDWNENEVSQGDKIILIKTGNHNIGEYLWEVTATYIALDVEGTLHLQKEDTVKCSLVLDFKELLRKFDSNIVLIDDGSDLKETFYTAYFNRPIHLSNGSIHTYGKTYKQ